MFYKFPIQGNVHLGNVIIMHNIVKFYYLSKRTYEKPKYKHSEFKKKLGQIMCSFKEDKK